MGIRYADNEREIIVSKDLKSPLHSIASSCVNIILFLLLIGLGVATVVGIAYVSVNFWVSQATGTFQTPTAYQYPMAQSSGIPQTPAAETTKAPNIEPIRPAPDFPGKSTARTPTPTRTPGPTPTLQLVDCTYFIKSGDTLYSLVRKFEVDSYSDISCSSSGCSLYYPTELKVGWRVTIRNVVDYVCLQRGGGYPDL